MHNIKKFTFSMHRNLNIRATQNKSNKAQMKFNKVYNIQKNFHKDFTRFSNSSSFGLIL